MAECKNIMVYVETAEGNPVKVGLEMLSPAKKLADKVTAVVIGGGVADAAKEVAKAGADQVICVDSEDYKEFNLDAYAQVLVELVKEENPEAVFVGGTQDGKDIAPVVAAKCNTGCASDVLRWRSYLYMPTLWWNCIGRCKDQDNTTDSNITFRSIPESGRPN